VNRVFKSFYILALSLVASVLGAYSSIENIRIVDGDTIKGIVDGKEITVRLVEIDAPEMDQPFGVESKKFLEKLIENKKVTLITEGKDRYGRTLGELFVNKDNINEKMVKSGFAWVYDRYVKSSLLYSYQDEAKSKTLGIWQSENPIAPWVWRRKK
jgi:endonuclease YncB( thermonuclease family)